MAKSDNIHFEEHHIPGLKAGVYSVEVNQKLEGKDSKGTAFSDNDAWKSRQEMYVAGDRFTLSPAVVYAVFPPNGNQGEHDNVLPHISFQRSTLPWERLTSADSSNDRTNSHPWMALVVFNENELNEGKVIVEKPSKLVDVVEALELESEPGEEDHLNQKVQTISVDKAWLKEVIPDENDLKWLSHIRKGEDINGQEFERATLLSNRIPTPGLQHFVHLVSLEKRYTSDHKFDFSKGKTKAGLISLVSLHSWSFSCPDTEVFRVTELVWENWQSEKLSLRKSNPFDPSQLFRGKEAFVNELLRLELIPQDEQVRVKETMKKIFRLSHYETETFKGLINHLDRGNLTSPIRSPHPSADPFLLSGSLPLPHALREGAQTVSWYRGPLVSAKVSSNTVELELPVRNADELLRYDTATGMFDTSYAAAWQLGRMMTLKNKALSMKLFEWKRAHAHQLKYAEQLLVHGHLPFTDREFHGSEESTKFETITNYFEGLNLLKEVPFNYLVPDESYLPKESIRFFRIDPLWVESLIDGAFSIGRVSSFDHYSDKQIPQTALHQELSGVLIRSEAISGWPDTIVEGFDEKITNGDFIPDFRPLNPPLDLTDSDDRIEDDLDRFIVPKNISDKIPQLSENLSLSALGKGSWQLIDNDNHAYYLIRKDGNSVHVYDMDKLPLLRFERLSPNVLLCIFKGIVNTVDVHLPAEGLHFGFIRPFGEHPDFYKELKELEGPNAGKKMVKYGAYVDCTIGWKNKNLRIVNSDELMKKMKAELRKPISDLFSPAHFAVEMIEGIPKIRFTNR